MAPGRVILVVITIAFFAQATLRGRLFGIAAEGRVGSRDGGLAS